MAVSVGCPAVSVEENIDKISTTLKNLKLAEHECTVTVDLKNPPKDDPPNPPKDDSKRLPRDDSKLPPKDDPKSRQKDDPKRPKKDDLKKAPKDDPKIKLMAKIVTCMLNDIGGIIRMTFAHGASDCPGFSKWKKETHQYLEGFIPGDILSRCVRLEDVEDQNKHTGTISILIKKSPRFITRNSNMYRRTTEETKKVFDSTEIEHIITKRTEKSGILFANVKSFEEGQECYLAESEYHEFKTGTKDLFHLKKAFEDPRCLKNLFAFANTVGGGNLVFGIKEAEKRYTINGQGLKNIGKENGDDKKFRSIVEENLSKGIWRAAGVVPKYEVDWCITYIPVLPKVGKLYVVVIHVQQFSGGVWREPPCTYRFSENKLAIQQLSFAEWRSHFTKSQNSESKNDVCSEENDTSSDPIQIPDVPESKLDTPTDKLSVPIEGAHESDIPTNSYAISTDKSPYEMKMMQKSEQPTVQTDQAISACSMSHEVSADVNPNPRQINIDARIQNEEILNNELSSDVTLPGDIDEEFPSFMSTSDSARPCDRDIEQDMVNFSDSEGEEESNILANVKSLHWAENRQNWDSNISEPEHENRLISNTNQEAQKLDMVQLKSPTNFTPSKDTISRAFPNEGVLNTISFIEETTRPSFAIVSPDWTKHFVSDDGNIDVRNPRSSVYVNGDEICAPQKHLFDVFAVDEDVDMHIFSVCSGTSPAIRDEEAWAYLMYITRSTKLKLMSYKLDGEVTGLCIHSHLLYTGDADQHKHTRCSLKEYTFLSAEDKPRLREVQIRTANFFLDRGTYIRDRLGDQILVKLTENQLHTVLVSNCFRFHFIEGPPGSGKTYTAWDVCNSFGREFTNYICTTDTFRKMVDFQEKGRSILIKTLDDFRNFVKEKRLSNKQHKQCIIVDDAHNLVFDESIWTELLNIVYGNRKMSLFIFTDNEFQNFKDGTKQSSDKLLELVQKFCMNKRESFFHKVMDDVLRNTRKIISFFKACVDDVEHSQINCSHDLEGDDVILLKLPNLLSEGDDNGLVDHIKTLLFDTKDIDGSPKYEAKDITILVDSGNAEQHVTNYIDILKAKLVDTKVHRAVYPIEGITVELLDNFVGLETLVCLFVMSQGMLDPKSDTKKRRSVLNPKFKAFISSRAVFRIEFITDFNLTEGLAQHFKFNVLPDRRDKNVREEKIPAYVEGITKVMKRKLPVSDVCFLNKRDDHTRLIVVSSGRLKLLSGDSEEKTLNIVDTAVDLVAVTADLNQLAVAHHKQGTDIFMFKLSMRNEDLDWSTDGEDYELPGQPWGMDWALNDTLVVITKGIQNSDTRLSLYGKDGQLLWKKDQEETSIIRPERLAVGPNNFIYVMDYDNHKMRVFPTNGDIQSGDNHRRVELYRPKAVCTDKEGRHVFVAYHNKHGVCIVSMFKTENLTKKDDGYIIIKSRSVTSLAMHDDELLAIGTDKKLVLYNVADILCK